MNIVKKHPIRIFTILQPIIFAVVTYLQAEGQVNDNFVKMVAGILESLAVGLVGYAATTK